MAPEQALGKNDELDARTDLYSATVLLHELVTLRHYLGERPSVEATLAAIVGEDVSIRRLLSDRHPHQAALPAELMYTVAKGLQKDPARRFQTAGEMIEELQDVLEGRAAVRCEVTLTKRHAPRDGALRRPAPAARDADAAGGAGLGGVHGGVAAEDGAGVGAKRCDVALRCCGALRGSRR